LEQQSLTELREQAAAALTANEMEKAEALYISLVEQEPNSASNRFALGSLFYQKQDYKKAIDHLQQAALIEPEAVDIAYNFAACLTAIGDRLGALLQLQRATKYCKDDPYFVPRIADLSVRLSEPAAAITLLSRLQKLLPNDQIILANANSMLGNWRESFKILKRLKDSVPNDPAINQKLSIAAGSLRDYPAAISAYERYLQLVKPTANDYLRFADLLLLARNADRCERALELALELGEDGPDVYLLKARTARLKGNYQSMHESLEEVLKRMPNNGQAWSIRAEVANEEELDGLIKELNATLAQRDEIAQLNHRHQSLLYYALADMQDRAKQYSEASQSLLIANDVQHAVVRSSNITYSATETESQFSELILNYNPEVFDQADLKTPESESSKTPIFIVGMPRSGTTLVERILGQSSHVYNAGEQDAMEFVAAHCRHQVKTQRLPKPEQISSSQWAVLRQMYLDKLPEFSNKIFTDKLPHNFRNVGLILKLFPEARIIQMHRQKNDVLWSIYARAFSAEHNYANRWQDLNHFYDQSELLMAHWSNLKSSRIIDVQYENLVQDPQGCAKQIVEFCGFEWSDNYLNFHGSTNQSFTFSEMQVRQPISDKRIGRWRNYENFIQTLSSES